MKNNLIQSSQELSNEISKLSFGEPTAYVYNPLEYAWAIHEQYLELLEYRKNESSFFGYESGSVWNGSDGGAFWRNSRGSGLDGVEWRGKKTDSRTSQASSG